MKHEFPKEVIEIAKRLKISNDELDSVYEWLKEATTDRTILPKIAGDDINLVLERLKLDVTKGYTNSLEQWDSLYGNIPSKIIIREMFHYYNGPAFKAQQWISVDDDMPKDNSEVLISFKDGSGVLLLDYNNSEHYNQNGFWLNENGGEYMQDFTDQVSHWQYKPKSANGE